MAFEDPNVHLTDPFLLNILDISNAARQQTTAILDLISSRTIDPSNRLPDPKEPDDQLSQLSTSQKQLYSHLAKIRSLNRRLAHLVRETKTITSASRNEVDTLHLNLQNLYYEQRHLRGEIASCENFNHPYTILPLIPLEDFYERFPDMIDQSEEDLMRARIAEEHRERTELEEQRKALVKRKQQLMQENAKRKEELVALDKDLEAFIDAAKPIQKTFEKEY